MMAAIRVIVITLLVSIGSALSADSNVEPVKLRFSLSNQNRANIVRLKNDNNIVKYILEVWLDGWEIDGPDDQLGGSLCFRINRAGGKYLPGCLLCKPDAVKNYSPSDCDGIFTKDMLESFFNKSKQNEPIRFEGAGMRLAMRITKLEFSSERFPANGQQKVKAMDFEIEIIPDKKIPLSGTIVRK